jgi:hypothetical protein
VDAPRGGLAAVGADLASEHRDAVAVCGRLDRAQQRRVIELVEGHYLLRRSFHFLTRTDHRRHNGGSS